MYAETGQQSRVQYASGCSQTLARESLRYLQAGFSEETPALGPSLCTCTCLPNNRHTSTRYSETRNGCEDAIEAARLGGDEICSKGKVESGVSLDPT